MTKIKRVAMQMRNCGALNFHTNSESQDKTKKTKEIYVLFAKYNESKQRLHENPQNVKLGKLLPFISFCPFGRASRNASRNCTRSSGPECSPRRCLQPRQPWLRMELENTFSSCHAWSSSFGFNPVENYISQSGSFPQVGVKI